METLKKLLVLAVIPVFSISYGMQKDGVKERYSIADYDNKYFNNSKEKVTGITSKSAIHIPNSLTNFIVPKNVDENSSFVNELKNEIDNLPMDCVRTSDGFTHRFIYLSRILNLINNHVSEQRPSYYSAVFGVGFLAGFSAFKFYSWWTR